MTSPEPRPYRPCVVTRAVLRSAQSEPSKPWMRQRPDESFDQWRHRVYRTCYHCGEYNDDLEALKRHEDAH
jgi:hypothetical protein